MSAPVTVSVTRHVDPRHTTQMLAWMQAGTSMAEKFDGFLGSGWVRPSVDSTDWHMLYRFADADSLAAWEASPQRAWWLEAAAGDVEERRRERRTGIEGWFDEPASVESLSAAPVAPPRWKQMIVIFMGFFPLSLAVNYVVGHTPLVDWPLVPRVLATIVVLTPLMTYVVLPWITRRMSWWLHR
ncbi:antibiotic biosynthesis monooxygenase [Nocardioides hwasunensis]|uniref:Antibiotic biosynthesis monooxygenase n=1 Tax=Nocardioides hwasunensis TaxID=397258 RepID=A0ABR8MLH1_9ACTN|nr:antibiotic biosynthesis monooxygenase [Nocardioides hwasunensis]MBD3916868.1 antibiotic biosynthesis monooxygenase [Nocardioides hwasunensis]